MLRVKPLKIGKRRILNEVVPLAVDGIVEPLKVAEPRPPKRIKSIEPRQTLKLSRNIIVNGVEKITIG